MNLIDAQTIHAGKMALSQCSTRHEGNPVEEQAYFTVRLF